MAQSKISPINTTSQEENIRQVVLVVRNIALNGLLFVALGVYLAIQTGGAWQAYQFIILSTQVVLINFVSVALIRHGRLKLGAWLFFTSDLIAPIWASLLVSKLGYVALAYILVTTYFMIRYAMPREARRAAIVFTVFGLVISFLAEWMDPTWRLVSSPMLTVAPILTGLLGAVFFATIVRQAWSGSLRSKLISAFLVVALIPLVIIAYFNSRSSRNALIESENQKLYSAAQQTAAELDEFMNSNIEAVRVEAQTRDVLEYLSLPASQRPGSDEEKYLQLLLATLLRQNPIYIDSIAIFDPRGITLIDTFTADIGTNKSDRAYFKDVIQTGRPLVSDLEFSETTGAASIYFAAPVRNSSGEIIGVLRKRYNAAILQKYLTANNKLAGEGSFPVLVDNQTYIRLAHGNDPALNFKLIVPVDAATLAELQATRQMPPGTSEELSTDSPELKAGLENYAEQPFFAAEFRHGDNTLEQGAVTLMKTQPWLVVFAQSQDIFLAPITAQANASTLIALVLAAAVAMAGFFVSQTLSGPIVRLTHTAETIAGGDINVQAKVESQDEIGTLAGAFNRMTSQLREFIATLESRVAERTRNLELAGEVGRTVSQVRALDVMLKDAAELIREQFDLYYVQVYLTDPSQTNLTLESGTGTVGAELLSRGHRLPLNTASINGRAAAEKRSVVISNTTESPTFKPNPLLPDTRSEMAVPLLIGNRVVGVLDMQSRYAGKLNEDVLSAFEALAGQLAIAIQNANFLAETERARAEVETQARRLTRANWVDYMDAIHKPEEVGFVFEKNQIAPMTQAEQAQPQMSANALSAPIAVTGEALGNLVVEMGGESPIARTNELVNTVAQQVARQIESLRLLESAERYRFEAEEASRRITHEGWQDYMDANADKGLGYIYDLKEVRSLNKNEARQAEESDFSLPLKVHDETVGKLVVQGIEAGDSEAIELATAVVERLGEHIEGLRLSKQTEQALASTQRLAQREQALRQITSAVRGSTDPATILRSAVRELGTLLGRKTIVRLATAEQASQTDRLADLVGGSAAIGGNEPLPPAESQNAVGGDQ